MQLNLDFTGDYLSLLAMATLLVQGLINGQSVDTLTLQTYLNVATGQVISKHPDINSDQLQADILLEVAP